jgi:hypothetical protein
MDCWAFLNLLYACRPKIQEFLVLPGPLRARKSLSRVYRALNFLTFGVILKEEQIDVRRVLLADSPTAPTQERRNSFHFRFSISIFVFCFDKDLLWLH